MRGGSIDPGVLRRLIALVAVVVVGCAAILWFAFGRSAEQDPGPAGPVTGGSVHANGQHDSGKHAKSKHATSKPKAGKRAHADAAKSRKELFAQALDGRLAVKCTYDQKDRRGTSYLRGKAHLRIDFVTAEGSKGHILQDGGTGYVWSDGQPTGVKYTGGANNQFGQAMSGFTPEKLARQTRGPGVHCARYTGDQSVFEVPSGVDFEVAGQGGRSGQG